MEVYNGELYEKIRKIFSPKDLSSSIRKISEHEIVDQSNGSVGILSGSDCFLHSLVISTFVRNPQLIHNGLVSLVVVDDDKVEFLSYLFDDLYKTAFKDTSTFNVLKSSENISKALSVAKGYATDVLLVDDTRSPFVMILPMSLIKDNHSVISTMVRHVDRLFYMEDKDDHYLEMIKSFKSNQTACYLIHPRQSAIVSNVLIDVSSLFLSLNDPMRGDMEYLNFYGI